MSRPPADVSYKEIFFDEKCVGGNTGRDTFFKWCSNPRSQPSIYTRCSNFSGTKGPCDMSLKFLTEDQLESVTRGIGKRFATSPILSPVMNSSTPGVATTLASTIGDSEDIGPPFVAIRYNHTCDFGTNKHSSIVGNIRFKESTDYDTIRTYCHQRVYGIPYALPIWLIILIILLVAAGVGGAFYLFWKYWLRRRVYGKEKSANISNVESHWTLGPNLSNAGSTRSIRSGNSRQASSKSHSRSNPSSVRSLVSQRSTRSRPPTTSHRSRS